MTDNVPKIALALFLVLAFMCDAPMTQAQDTLARLRHDAARLREIEDMANQIKVNNPGILLPVNGGK